MDVGECEVEAGDECQVLVSSEAGDEYMKAGEEGEDGDEYKDNEYTCFWRENKF